MKGISGMECLACVAILVLAVSGCIGPGEAGRGQVESTLQAEGTGQAGPDFAEGGSQPDAAPQPGEAPPQKSLEDMSLKLSDFPPTFSQVESDVSYRSDVSEFTGGDAERMRELTDAGWLENYYVEYVRRSEVEDELAGKRLVLEDYSISLSRYDREKDYKSFMESSTGENEEWLVEQGYTLLDGEFGDGSIFGEYAKNSLLGYTLQFHRGNIYVNIYAKGRVGDIGKEHVAKYGRIVESRID